MRRFAAILAFVAIVLSGGVARFVHFASAHGGDSCRGHAHVGGSSGIAAFGGRSLVERIACGHAHGAQHRSASSAPSCEQIPEPPASSDPPSGDDCATCAELAANLLRPLAPLALDPRLVLTGIRRDAPASSAPALAVLRSIAARPPPARA